MKEHPRISPSATTCRNLEARGLLDHSWLPSPCNSAPFPNLPGWQSLTDRAARSPRGRVMKSWLTWDNLQKAVIFSQKGMVSGLKEEGSPFLLWLPVTKRTFFFHWSYLLHIWKLVCILLYPNIPWSLGDLACLRGSRRGSTSSPSIRKSYY